MQKEYKISQHVLHIFKKQNDDAGLTQPHQTIIGQLHVTDFVVNKIKRILLYKNYVTLLFNQTVVPKDYCFL